VTSSAGLALRASQLDLDLVLGSVFLGPRKRCRRDRSLSRAKPSASSAASAPRTGRISTADPSGNVTGRIGTADPSRNVTGRLAAAASTVAATAADRASRPRR
jgi:hypothetical protein